MNKRINPKNKPRGVISILVILVVLILNLFLTISLVYAKCNVEFVTYYGNCDTAGDILVSDSHGQPVAEQLYGVDRGCYKGAYAISVPGGKEDDCPASVGDKLSFSVSGKKYAESGWIPDAKVINLNLERPKYKESFGNLISSGAVYLLLTVLVLIVVVHLATQYYRRRRDGY